MDYLMRLYEANKDPPGLGDEKSWFLFYKWMVEGEVFMPLKKEDRLAFYIDIKAGDRLWFSIDNSLHGYVTLLRVEEDMVGDKYELWYSGEGCYTFRGPSIQDTSVNYGTVIPEDVARAWMQACSDPTKKSSDASKDQ